jgi:hypothetical protein
MFGRRQLGYLVMLARGSGSGGEGGPSAGVATFKGRDGDVVPAANDYAASQVSNDSSVSGANVKLALNALLTSLGSLSSTVGALVTGVSSFNARGGAVTPAANDYAASQVSNDSGVSGLNVKAALDALASTIGDFVSGVSSFNGREGAVVPESDDYAASEVTNDSGIYGSTVKLALETLGSAIVGVASDLASLVTGVSSFNARGGAVTPAANDYAASQVSNDSSVSGANVKLALQTLASAIGSVSSSLATLSSTVGALVTGVSSFNARGGAVTPAVNDYAASQVSNDSSVSGANVKLALQTLASAIGVLVTGVSSFNARGGAVTPAANDYAASQVSNDSSVSGANVKLALNALLTSLGSLSSTVGALVTGVSSFNARGGAVTPAANDYAASQVSNDSSVSGANVKLALQTLASAIGALVTGVSSFNARGGAVTPAANDYAASQVSNDSSVSGANVKLALQTLASTVGALVTGVSSFNTRGGAVTPAANDYAASQVSNDSSVSGANVKLALQTLAGLLLSLGSATPLQLGTATAGNGSTAAPINHVHPSAFANAGSENLSFDLLPTAQAQGALNTGNSVTSSVTLGAGRRYLLQAEAWVEDASGNVLFFRSLSVRAHRKATGDAILILQSPEEDPYSTVAMTFVATVSVGDIVFTLANASGTNGVYNLFVGTEACDKP